VGKTRVWIWPRFVNFGAVWELTFDFLGNIFGHNCGYPFPKKRCPRQLLSMRSHNNSIPLAGMSYSMPAQSLMRWLNQNPHHHRTSNSPHSPVPPQALVAGVISSWRWFQIKKVGKLTALTDICVIDREVNCAQPIWGSYRSPPLGLWELDNRSAEFNAIAHRFCTLSYAAVIVHWRTLASWVTRSLNKDSNAQQGF